jgi:hypothetical protein
MLACTQDRDPPGLRTVSGSCHSSRGGWSTGAPLHSAYSTYQSLRMTRRGAPLARPRGRPCRRADGTPYRRLVVPKCRRHTPPTPHRADVPTADPGRRLVVPKCRRHTPPTPRRTEVPTAHPADASSCRRTDGTPRRRLIVPKSSWCGRRDGTPRRRTCNLDQGPEPPSVAVRNARTLVCRARPAWAVPAGVPPSASTSPKLSTNADQVVG